MPLLIPTILRYAKFPGCFRATPPRPQMISFSVIFVAPVWGYSAAIGLLGYSLYYLRGVYGCAITLINVSGRGERLRVVWGMSWPSLALGPWRQIMYRICLRGPVYATRVLLSGRASLIFDNELLRRLSYRPGTASERRIDLSQSSPACCPFPKRFASVSAMQMLII